MEKKTAFISVYDHSGVKKLAEGLVSLGYEIVSIGKTAEYLSSNGVGLADSGQATFLDSFGANIVVVNFRPFKETVQRRGLILDEVVGDIETEGFAVARNAAKRWHETVVLIDPEDYAPTLAKLNKAGLDADERYNLACKVFEYTAAYDALVASYLRRQQDNSPMFPQNLTLAYERVQSMRYGENPHQRAAFYRELQPTGNGIDASTQMGGLELSFNNVADANLALDILKEFTVVVPCAVIVRHMNPCGVGIGIVIEDAYTEAYEADPDSIPGGAAALNREVDFATAVQLAESRLDVVVAPSFAQDALQFLKQDAELRLLSLNDINKPNYYGMLDMRKIAGGLLVQELDTELYNENDLATVTKRAPTKRELNQMTFAWRVAKHAKTDSIVLVKGNSTVGIGAGQTHRLAALELALNMAGESQAQGSVMASEAYFDSLSTLKTAIDAGVAAVIQPGGSPIDAEVIALCDEAGVAMVFTGMRHFKH